LYRHLLNAFYRAVKRISRSDFVVTAGTAPYGDPPGGPREQPVTFDESLFCLSGAARLRPTRCGDPAHFDALSHHPYGIGGPLWHALDAKDVAVPDVYRLRRLLHAAQRLHRVLPRGHKRLWVTEISWDSKPPDPHGILVTRQARWYEQALYVLWREGVDTVLWLEIVDSPPVPSYDETSQGGVYYRNGQAKPSALAVRFPFVTTRTGVGHVRAWGRAPAAGRLTIERLRHGHWVVLRTLGVRARQVFQATLAMSGTALLRARVAGQTSLTWTQR
jgi:hypothetical protein